MSYPGAHTMPTARFAILATVLLASQSSGIQPASAAVLVCGDLVAGDGREHANEPDAKRAALASWLAKAGPDFTWRLATNKAITCLQAPSGNILCKASGHPCALRQVPPQGPLKRLMPSAPGSGT